MGPTTAIEQCQRCDSFMLYYCHVNFFFFFFYLGFKFFGDFLSASANVWWQHFGVYLLIYSMDGLILCEAAHELCDCESVIVFLNIWEEKKRKNMNTTLDN